MSSKSPSNRKFGLLFAAVFLVIALIVSFRSTAFYICGLLAIVFLTAALLIPRVLAPLKRRWLMFGWLLNWIISPIFLGLIYLLAIIPVGGLVRLFGKDLLSLKHDPVAGSYWVGRDGGEATAESLKDQF